MITRARKQPIFVLNAEVAATGTLGGAGDARIVSARASALIQDTKLLDTPERGAARPTGGSVSQTTAGLCRIGAARESLNQRTASDGVGANAIDTSAGETVDIISAKDISIVCTSGLAILSKNATGPAVSLRGAGCVITEAASAKALVRQAIVVVAHDGRRRGLWRGGRRGLLAIANTSPNDGTRDISARAPKIVSKEWNS